MKPDWFVCEKCLWFQTHDEVYPEYVIDNHNEEDGNKVDYCFWEGIGSWTKPRWFCHNWTCANCWERYDDSVPTFPEDRDWPIVNHNKCKPVKFEE